MAKKRDAPGTLDAAMAELIATDPEVRDRMRRIVNKALDELEFLVVHGSTPTKIRLLGTSMNSAMRTAVAPSEQDGDAAKLRAQWEQIAAAMREPLEQQFAPPTTAEELDQDG